MLQDYFGQPIIDYPPESLRAFHAYSHQWIDNTHFVLPPENFLADAANYVSIAKEMFLEEGWEGTGEIGLIWLPPFVFLRDEVPTVGVILWHVKQIEDGISWILSPMELTFEFS